MSTTPHATVKSLFPNEQSTGLGHKVPAFSAYSDGKLKGKNSAVRPHTSDPKCWGRFKKIEKAKSPCYPKLTTHFTATYKNVAYNLNDRFVFLKRRRIPAVIK